MKSGAFPPVMAHTDQARGVPAPAPGLVRGGDTITLPSFTDVPTAPSNSADGSYPALLKARRSIREFTDAPITQAQLSFLLWSMYSVQKLIGQAKSTTLRPVPSGGARHTFEIYFLAINIADLAPGLYHYLPLFNVGEQRATIERIGELPSQEIRSQMLTGQDWTLTAGAIFFVASVPYRAEWRYGELAHRMIMTDLGYVGQDFMLSATAMGLGSCQIAGYNQDLCDAIFGLDGTNEFFLIAMPIGTI